MFSRRCRYFGRFRSDYTVCVAVPIGTLDVGGFWGKEGGEVESEGLER